MADLGLQLIEKVYKKLQLDDQWSTRAERSFSWVGHRLEQTVSTTPPIEDGEFTLFGLRAETVVVDNVRAAEHTIDRVLSDLNRFTVGNCYSFAPGESRIYATTCTWVHELTAEWRLNIFDVYTTGQLCFAEAEADYLADKCQGEVSVRANGRSGLRKDPAAMLNAADDVFAPKGLEPCRYKNALEFEAVADAARRSEKVAAVGGAAEGIALECSFGDHTAISVISSIDRHRRLGSGLTVRVHLPTTITREEGYRIAAALNRHERTEGPLTGHTGAWCVDAGPVSEVKVTYRSFLPNVIYMNGLIMDTAIGCIGRMSWAAHEMNAQSAIDSVWKRLARRFGVRRQGD